MIAEANIENKSLNETIYIRVSLIRTLFIVQLYALKTISLVIYFIRY